jgi:multisubunit Na+/H+ antiporter MnhB subunit
MGLLTLAVTCAIALVTVVVTILLALATKHRQERALPEWWIPLFVKAAVVGATGTVVAFLLFEYGQWRTRDAIFEQIVRQSTVIREDRQPGRTVYEFDPALSAGWSRLNRYEFRIVWEAVAAFGAIGAVLAGLLALSIARIEIRRRTNRPALPVLARDEPRD